MVSEVNSASLLIAIEPEATLCYCRLINFTDFIVGCSDAKLKTGDKMMIIVAGGN